MFKKGEFNLIDNEQPNFFKNQIDQFIEKSLLHAYMVLQKDIEEHLIKKEIDVAFTLFCQSEYNQDKDYYSIVNKRVSIKNKNGNTKKTQSSKIMTDNLLLKFQMFMQYTNYLLEYAHIYDKPHSINLSMNLPEYIDMSCKIAKKYNVNMGEANFQHYFTNINNPSTNYHVLKKDILKKTNDLILELILNHGPDINIDFENINKDGQQFSEADLKRIHQIKHSYKIDSKHLKSISIESYRAHLKSGDTELIEHFETGLVSALIAYEKKQILSNINISENYQIIEKKRL